MAEDAISDALTFVPFRDLPWWLRRMKVTGSARQFVSWRWACAVEDVQSGFAALKNLRAARRKKRGPDANRR